MHEIDKKNKLARNKGKKVLITETAIDKVPLIKYKEIDPTEYKKLQFLTKLLLRYAKDNNDSNEVSILYKMGDNELLDENYGISFGDEHGVVINKNSKAGYLLYKSKECILVCLHNHPSGSILSLYDINVLITNQNLKMITAVTNRGKISYLVKGKKYNVLTAVKLFYDSVVGLTNESSVNDEIKAIKKFLKSCYKAGMIYKK